MGNIRAGLRGQDYGFKRQFLLDTMTRKKEGKKQWLNMRQMI